MECSNVVHYRSEPVPEVSEGVLCPKCGQPWSEHRYIITDNVPDHLAYIVVDEEP